MLGSSAAPSASPAPLPREGIGALPKNIGLFFAVVLPGTALASMVGEGVPLFGWKSDPIWHVGWDPLMWLVCTAPWIAPTVLLVPVVHLVGREVARRTSRRTARWVALAVSAGLFPLGVAMCFGPGNVDARTLVPLAVAATVYGAVLRIPSPRRR